MPNVLTAIESIAEFKSNDLKTYFEARYNTRINQVGEQLEVYVKDAICGSFETQDSLAFSRGIFSYLGNQNNGPDAIITNGDAFEIKKIENLKASLALNNSYPKDRLYRDDHKITDECRSIDGGNWSSKDIFYVIGVAEKRKIKHLSFIHGRCYAAERSVYESKFACLKQGIDSFFTSEGWETTRTAELGRINRMDPLGITNFRVRGMWEIENPVRVFDYIYRVNDRVEFSLVALMTEEKYNSFPQQDRLELEKNTQLKTKTVNVKNPNNPAQLMQAKLITLIW